MHDHDDTGEIPECLLKTGLDLPAIAANMISKRKSTNALPFGYKLQGYWNNTTILVEDADGFTVCTITPA